MIFLKPIHAVNCAIIFPLKISFDIIFPQVYTPSRVLIVISYVPVSPKWFI